ncbi:MAG: transcriptional repressor [Clostridia bacterium]|nr:transcriptional repressor [Clostridia bacterium]
MQTKRNFSAKREAIYNTIALTKNHPTAEWVYEQLKPQISDLSLGTVYRNISVLRNMGLIKSVGVVDGQERFDADVSQHSHFICKGCFKIIDVPVRNTIADGNMYVCVEKQCDVKVQSHSVTFYGLCSECAKKQQQQ